VSDRAKQQDQTRERVAAAAAQEIGFDKPRSNKAKDNSHPHDMHSNNTKSTMAPNQTVEIETRPEQHVRREFQSKQATVAASTTSLLSSQKQEESKVKPKTQDMGAVRQDTTRLYCTNKRTKEG